MQKIIYIAALAVFLTSCGIYGKYSRPDMITGKNLYGNTIEENADSSTLATLSYKEIFTDPLLQDLIATALERNTDIQTLEFAVKQAEAGYTASKLAFIPGFNFAPKGGYNISETSYGWDYAIPLAMDWEIDIFGKFVNQKRKAGAALAMTQEMKLASQTQVVATVASLYFQLLMLDEQLIITDSTARKWRETVNVMQLMKEAGMMNEVSVSQTEATCYAIETGVLNLQKRIQNVENSLCLILKQVPQHIVRGSMQEQVLPEELNVGVSAQLLANRPDVRQAEYNLEQYFYGVQHARSQFYPSIKINGSIAYIHNFIPSIIGSLTQPIFAHGAIKSNYEISKAKYEQALLAFEQKLLAAGSQVNNALLQCKTARQKRVVREKQIAALTKAMEYTQELMTNGSTTYLEVIYTQQTLLDAQTNQLADWLEEAQGVVTLYQSLGGGVK